MDITMATNTTRYFVRFVPLIPRQTIYIIRFVLRPLFLIVVCGFGSVANIINIVVFYRQGILTDSCTPCLVGLAFVDFCSNLSFFVQALFLVPTGFFIGLEHNSRRYFITLGHIAHTLVPLFTRITVWITTYIAIERVVCVTLPFRVKVYFTPKRSCVVILSIMLLNVGLCSSEYLVNGYGWVQSHYPNGTTYFGQTLSGLISMRTYGEMKMVNAVALQTTFFTIVFVSNIVIIVKVVYSTKFRTSLSKSTTRNKDAIGSHAEEGFHGDKLSTHHLHDDTENATVQKGAPTTRTFGSRILSSFTAMTLTLTFCDCRRRESSRSNGNKSQGSSKSKDAILIRMMLVLTLMFTVCFAPSFIFSLGVNILRITNYYNLTLSYILMSISGFADFLEPLNAAINFIVYSTMSSRFRKELKHLFCSSKKD